MVAPEHTSAVLLGDTAPVDGLEAYLAGGGGEGLAAARRAAPAEVIDQIERAGLRGRGGAGFPTARKWRAVAGDPCPRTYVVCNAAEGEPATFKDRHLLRRNPYVVVEGALIAAHAVGAAGVFVALKEKFARERQRLEGALADFRAAGLTGDTPVEIVTGPDEYLFGEEKAMLEVVERRPALPRALPPYQVGLFAARGSANPTVVNNAETLACAAAIMRHGADWFRGFGTRSSPGTMLFTVCGDVRHPGVYELPLGVTLGTLLDVAGGMRVGRRLKAVFPGASNAVLTAADTGLALDFDSVRARGSGLGSAGFVVYDDSTCIVAAAAVLARFLYHESCGQCPACKQGALRITEALERIDAGDGTDEDVQAVRAGSRSVTAGQRCGLPTGTATVAGSVVDAFADEFDDHRGRPCPSARPLAVPLLADYDAQRMSFDYAERVPASTGPPLPAPERPAHA